MSGDRRPSAISKWHDAGYRAAMSVVLEQTVQMLAEGHAPQHVLHGVMHLAAACEQLDRLDGTQDVGEVVSTGWGRMPT